MLTLCGSLSFRVSGCGLLLKVSITPTGIPKAHPAATPACTYAPPVSPSISWNFNLHFPVYFLIQNIIISNTTLSVTHCLAVFVESAISHIFILCWSNLTAMFKYVLKIAENLYSNKVQLLPLKKSLSAIKMIILEIYSCESITGFD